MLQPSASTVYVLMVLIKIRDLPAVLSGDEYARIKDVNNVHNGETGHLNWVWREVRALVEGTESGQLFGELNKVHKLLVSTRLGQKESIRNVVLGVDSHGS